MGKQYSLLETNKKIKRRRSVRFGSVVSGALARYRVCIHSLIENKQQQGERTHATNDGEESRKGTDG
jgi:hypothetical protein